MTPSEKLTARIHLWRGRGYTHRQIADKVGCSVALVNLRLNGQNWGNNKHRRKMKKAA